MKTRKSLFAKALISAMVLSSFGFGVSQAFAESHPRQVACPHQAGCLFGGFLKSGGEPVCCIAW